MAKYAIETMGIAELDRAYEEKELSPVEVTQYLLSRIETYDKRLNTYIRLLPDVALDAAKASEKRMMDGARLSRLDGVPFGVKDIMFTKYAPTTAGCEYYKDFVPERNAFVLDRLLDCGAIPLGKTNTHQLAMGCTGDRSFAGAAHNPFDTNKVTGGSSSGSAASVAAGFEPFALGSDTGGSIRIPASFCGVVGMKPTHGLISLSGVFPVSGQFDHIGPLTRTVYDSAVALGCMAGHDPQDAFSIASEAENYTRLIGRSVAGMRVGVPYCLFEGRIVPSVEAYVCRAGEILREAGAELTAAEFPDLSLVRAAQKRILHFDCYTANKALIDGHREMIDPEVYGRMASEECTAEEYEEALAVIEAFRILFAEKQAKCDLLLLPSTGITAPVLDVREAFFGGVEHDFYESITGCLWQAIIARTPAISLPGGKLGGMPVGIQLIGRRREEAVVYQAAHIIEKNLALSCWPVL